MAAKPIARQADGDSLICLKITDMHKPLYQRDVDQAWVDRHAEVFDPDLLQVPDVSYRDGKWWVVDGLRRRELVRRAKGDDAEMVCRPHYGYSEQSEWTELFRPLNRDRMRYSGLEEFESALRLREPTEVSINRIVSEAGYTVGRGKSPTHIGAVTVLYDIYRTGKEERLRRALAVYAGAYGGSGSGKMVSVVLDAIGIVLRYYGEQITDERLIRKLAAAGNTRQLMGMSRGTGSGHGNVNVANAIIEVWNNGLRGYNKLELLVSKARQ